MKFYLRIFSNRRYDGAYLYLNEYSRYTVFEFSKEMTFNNVAFKANSRSKLKIWLNLNNLDVQRRPCLIAPYFNRRIYYAHFVLEEKRSEEPKQK